MLIWLIATLLRLRNSAPVSATQSAAVPDWLCYASLGASCSKAFDVNHSVLVSKLSQLDLPPRVLNWIISFLTCRSQVIECGNSVSLLLHINRSITQGSGVGLTHSLTAALDQLSVIASST